MSELLSDVRSKSSQGVKWAGIAEIAIRVLQFLTTVILARILLPEHFGIIGIAYIFVRLVTVIFDFGISSALIQKKDVSELHFSSAFLFYFVTAILFSVLIIFNADWLAQYFEEPRIESILFVLTIIFITNWLGVVPRVRLMRDLQFKLTSLIETFAILSSSVVAVISAFAGQGVWSFVYGLIAQNFTMMLLFNIYGGWKINWQFSRGAFSEVFRYGTMVLGTRIINYLNVNTPVFFIGKFLGSAQLGFFNFAYNLIDLPVQRISKNIMRVMFPAFSKIQEDSKGYKELYLQTNYLLTLLIFPIMFGLLLVAPQFIVVIYGDKWEAAILPMQILCIAGLIRSIWPIISVALMSLGKPEIELRLNLGVTLLLVPATFLLVGLGIEYVSLIFSGLILIFFLIGMYFTMTVVDITLKQYIKSIRLPVIATAVFYGIGLIANNYLLKGSSATFSLFITVLLSMVIYILIIWKADRNIFGKLLKMAKS